MIIGLLKLLVICYVLSDMANFIGELMSEVRPIFKSRVIAVIYNLLYYILSCNKCFSFWFSLIWTGDLFIATSVAIIVSIVKRIEYKYIKTEL